MRTLTFNFHSEQEEKVLLAFLNSLQYDYQVEGQESFRLSEEDVKGLLQTKRDFLERRTTTRPWDEIKVRVLKKFQTKPFHSHKNFSEKQ